MEVKINRITLGIANCYLLRHEGTILIDAGLANQETKFQRELNRLGVPASDIQLILATHGHADHIGSAAKIAEFTGAPIAIHQAERDWLEKGILKPPPGVTVWGRILASFSGLAKTLMRFQPAPVGVVFSDEEFSLAEFGIPGKVLPTPGHSPGSVTVLLDNSDAFVGDLAMNSLPLRLSPGLPILADDIQQVKDSWRRLFQGELGTIYPGHGKPFPAQVMREIAPVMTQGNLTDP
jgi:hydroxyacylglutathione hydrolase